MTFSKIFGDIYSYEFTKENLIQIIDPERIFFDRDYNLSYLYKLVENKYMDKYYLDDFLHFYASCHHEYEKYCNRIHFFKEEFDIKLLEDVFPQTSVHYFQSKYLGFTVIRPIKGYYIGRTLLSVYPNTNCIEEVGNGCDKRNILAIHKYHANLCGFDLFIDSTPFQSQDNVVHKCATTAIWIALSQSAFKFGYYSPTPYEIKISAPVYHKIRYPYSEILDELFVILESMIVFGVFGSEYAVLEDARDKFEWDVYLTSVNNLKECYRKDEQFLLLEESARKRILSGFFPRFIWRCSLLYEGSSILEILGDATEAKSHFPYFCMYFYDQKLKLLTTGLLKAMKKENMIKIIV